MLALSGVGAASGLLITDLRVVATLSQLTFIVVMFAAGADPLHSLPGVLQGSAYALQPTYAADGSRHALAGTLALDIGVLAACPWCRSSRSSAACAGAPHDPAQRVVAGAPGRRRSHG